MDWLGTINDSVQIVGIVVGLYFGFRGVDSWRSEMKARRRAEFAEEVLTMAYEARDKLAWTRNAWVFEGEGETRKPDDSDGPEDERIRSTRNMYYVPAERIWKATDFWARLDATEYRLHALFGPAGADALRRLRAIRVRIVLSSKALARHVGEDPEDQPPRESFQKWKEDIGYGTSDTDEMQAKIDDVIRSLEAECRPAIEGYQKQERDWWKWPRTN